MAKLIVLDEDPRLLEIIKYGVESHLSLEALLVESAERIKAAIEENGDAICLIADSYVVLGAWEQFVNCLNALDSAPQLIFCGDPFSNKSVAEFAAQVKAPIAGYVEKPHIIEPIVNLLKGIAKRTGTPENLRPAIHIPVNRKILCSLDEVPVDLFIRISDDKFVRVLHAGDAVAPSPLKALKDHPEDSLYVRNQDAEVLAKAFERWLHGLRQTAPTFDPRTDFSISASALCTIQGLFKALWFSTEVQNATRTTVSLVLKQLESEPRIQPFLRLLESNHESFIASHSMALAYMSCAFARALGWNSEFTLKKLALASVLHDIVLERDESARIRTTDEISELRQGGHNNDALAVENHPLLVAELVRSMHDYPLGVDLLVAHHHDLPGSRGFPSLPDARKIDQLSALFIFMHDFVDRYMTRADRENPLRTLNEMADDYKLKPFGPLYKAFRAMAESGLD